MVKRGRKTSVFTEAVRWFAFLSMLGSMTALLYGLVTCDMGFMVRDGAVLWASLALAAILEIEV